MDVFLGFSHVRARGRMPEASPWRRASGSRYVDSSLNSSVVRRRTPADQAELQIGSELRKWKRFKRGSHRRPMWSIKRSWQGSGCMMGPTPGPQPSSIDLPLPQLLRPASRGLHHRRRLRRDSAEYQLRKGCCGVVEESFDSRSSKHLVGTALTCRRRKALLDSSRQRRGGIWRGRWIG